MTDRGLAFQVASRYEASVIGAEKISDLETEIPRCTRCARLRTYCDKIGREKKRVFRDDTYWTKPVPGFGAAPATLWIVGLAPAAHGANRTGRMFTGDGTGSGLWLYRSLYRLGLASRPDSESRDDGLILRETYISSSVRCAPPDNKPTRAEREACFPFFQREFQAIGRPHLILALGRLAFETTLWLFEKERVSDIASGTKFSHGGISYHKDHMLITSYHPSRQNTQTGRLTRDAWEAVFDLVFEKLSARRVKKSSRE